MTCRQTKICFSLLKLITDHVAAGVSVVEIRVPTVPQSPDVVPPTFSLLPPCSPAAAPGTYAPDRSQQQCPQHVHWQCTDWWTAAHAVPRLTYVTQYNANQNISQPFYPITLLHSGICYCHHIDIRLSVWCCTLWHLRSVYALERCTIMFIGWHFLFTSFRYFCCRMYISATTHREKLNCPHFRMQNSNGHASYSRYSIIGSLVLQLCRMS